ncbi:hypothetical protein Tco_0565913 [Tanacetum coccineum]
MSKHLVVDWVGGGGAWCEGSDGGCGGLDVDESRMMIGVKVMMVEHEVVAVGGVAVVEVTVVRDVAVTGVIEGDEVVVVFGGCHGDGDDVDDSCLGGDCGDVVWWQRGGVGCSDDGGMTRMVLVQDERFRSSVRPVAYPRHLYYSLVPNPCSGETVHLSSQRSTHRPELAHNEVSHPEPPTKTSKNASIWQETGELDNNIMINKALEFNDVINGCFYERIIYEKLSTYDLE